LRSNNVNMTNAVAIAGASSTTLNLSTLGVQNGGDDIYVQAELTDGTCNQTAVSISKYQIITYDSLQVDLTASTFDVCFGSTPSGTLNAIVSGGSPSTNISYKWYEANNPAMGGKQDIFNETSPSLDLSVLGQKNGGSDIYIQVETTDGACGNVQDLSTQVIHLVTHENLQVSMLSGSQEVCYNQIPTGTISMLASAGRQPSNYTYRWLTANNASMTGAVPIVGETSSSLNLANLGALTGGSDVYIQGEATDVFCADVKTTANVYQIITWDQLVASTVSNQGGSLTSQQLCHNDPLPFGLEAMYNGGDTNDLFTFTWQFSSDPNFSQIDSSKAPQNDPQISSAEIGVFTDTTYVRCLVSDNCNDDSLSFNFSVNVWDELIAADARQLNSVLTTNIDLCFGQGLPDDLEVDYQGGDASGNYNFRWERSTDANFASNVTSFTLSANSSLASSAIGSLQIDTYFRCIVYDDCGDSSISNTFSVLVYPQFLPGDISANFNGSQNDTMRVCFGDPIDINRVVSASGADPATYSYFLEYKNELDPVSAYQSLPLSVNEASSFTLDSAQVLLSPGSYTVRQRIEANCNPVFTDEVTVYVNEPPYWGAFVNDYKPLFFQVLDPDLDDNDGNLTLCDGAQNVLLKLNEQEIINYGYQWSQGATNLNAISGARSVISWDVNANSASPLELDIDLLNRGLSCGRQVFMQSGSVAAGSSPDEDQLELVNTLILDSDPDITANFFRWGKINRSTLEWVYESAWDTARFFDFGVIDTVTYVYVMAAADVEGSICRSYSYYPSSFALSPDKSVQEINLEESDIAGTIDLYPNPNHGDFRLLMDEQEKVETIQAFDLRGRQLSLNWDSDQRRVNLATGVTGYVLLKVQTQKQVATFKILVQ
ncbi:MAG: hypothetical protein DA405_07625, partial [Bacteroidetes bacterium]